MPVFIKIIVGVDEAGRGPLAGPVIAAAVSFKEKEEIDGLADSKTLSEATIQKLAEEIKQKTNYAIAEATVAEIDELNIHHASLLAMKRAVALLAKQFKPNERVFVLVDGKFEPDLSDIEHPTEIICFAIIKGDSAVREISAASILAKDHRDRIMVAYHQIDAYKKYKFDEHKGYPTPKHKEALKQHGPCDIHRKSYAPVRRVSFREDEDDTVTIEKPTKRKRAYSVGTAAEKKATKGTKKVTKKEPSSEIPKDAPKPRGRSRSNSVAVKKASKTRAPTPKKEPVRKESTRRVTRSTTPSARRNSIAIPEPAVRASRSSSNDIVDRGRSRSRSRSNSIDPINSRDLSHEFTGDREHDRKVLQEKILQTTQKHTEKPHTNSPVRRTSRKSEHVRSIFLQQEAEKAKAGAAEVEPAP